MSKAEQIVDLDAMSGADEEEREQRGGQQVYLSIYECPMGTSKPALQLAIEVEGGGYRIFGPKFAGTSRLLRRYQISNYDVAKIRKYLDMAEPNQ